MSYPNQTPARDAPLLCWREGSVAHLRFNRPDAMNAIDIPMAQAFLTACRAIAEDPLVRAVWISGSGRAFMAGGDIATMRHDPPAISRELIDGMHGGLRLLAQLRAPVVASVHGAVAGGGFGLMLCCDLVIAAEATRFCVAYPLIGASCDCSTSWALPRLVGMRKALELALLADTFDAMEALRLGLVNRVVPQTELHVNAERTVQRLAAGPTLAYGHLKRLIRISLDNDLSAQLDAEAAGFQACAGTGDFAEGVAAFLDKRTPHFTGA